MMAKRGLLIWAWDLGPYWVELAALSGLNALGLHPIPGVGEDDPRSLESLLAAMETDSFKRDARALEAAGIGLEIEAHAMHWLMPRERFDSNPDWFRADEGGTRRADLNFCPSNQDALQCLEERTELLVRRLAPYSTTHRYYLWADDNGEFCHCRACAGTTASDQALAIYNRMLVGVRRVDPLGTLSYLAYQNTIAAPVSIRPSPGIFLEYAPIDRDSRYALDDPSIAKNAEQRSHIDALLGCFGREGSQVLEYWMDNSYFYRWTPPYGELPFYRGVLGRDVGFYRERGFEHITSFACGLNADYEGKYGRPPVAEYGRILRGIQSPAVDVASTGFIGN
jgi:hypothetical protein